MIFKYKCNIFYTFNQGNHRYKNDNEIDINVTEKQNIFL